MGLNNSKELKWSECNYFLINGKFYDLTKFFDRHPGGRKILKYSKVYAYDATTHFNMHHLDFERAYSILQKFEITDKSIISQCRTMIEKELKTSRHFQLQLGSKLTTTGKFDSSFNTPTNNNNNNSNTTTAPEVSDDSDGTDGSDSDSNPRVDNINSHHDGASEDSIFSESDGDGSDSSTSDSIRKSSDSCDNNINNNNNDTHKLFNGTDSQSLKSLKMQGAQQSLSKTATGTNVDTRFMTNIQQSKNSENTGKKSSIVNNNNKDEFKKEEGVIEYNREYVKPQQYCFEFSKPGGFYYELREEANKYFKETKRKTGPRGFSLAWWWCLWAIYFTFLFYNSYCIRQYVKNNNLESFPSLSWDTLNIYTRTVLLTMPCAIISAWLGGFGHQWVHMTAWRKHGHILDWVGLYSHAFQMEHLLWHHPFTNTIADHHFEGTDPFIVVDPLSKRNIIQKYCTSILVMFTLLVGVYGNYLFNIGNIIKGGCALELSIVIFPIKCFFYCYLSGSKTAGCLMFAIEASILSYYYFTFALMNHNQLATWDLNALVNSKDWGEFQLSVSCDIGYNYSYLQSMLCLWLNYHTVHHLLPTTDLSHHQELQLILTKVSKKHGLKYHYASPWKTYLGLLHTTSVANAFNEILSG